MPKNSVYADMEVSEKTDLKLRGLYRKDGYERFKMGKFEEYDLYAQNRDFIPTEDIITVTGEKGKLLALRPDLTLSIVKYFRPEQSPIERLYYSETIYRSDKKGNYRELKQTGLECLGNIGIEETAEVALLAALSLKSISSDYIMDISHMGFLSEMLDGLTEKQKSEIIFAIGRKNIPYLEKTIADYEIDEEISKRILMVANSYGNYKEVLKTIKALSLSDKALKYLDEIEAVCRVLAKNKFGNNINIDFSIINNMTYYSGILFKGYIAGISSGILSGGRYDGVMERMDKKGGAIGFALYLDELNGTTFEEDGLLGNSSRSNTSKYDDYINIALPKGRLGNKIYELFEKSGYACAEIKEDNRKLVFENKRKKIRFFWVKPSDVTVYVERGTADIGACGSDIIEEYRPDIYELLDLKKGKCRMCIASKKGYRDDTSRTLRVATKYPEIARKYYDRESRNIDIIKLHGSIELAPVLNMADVIVDIVETGKTLKENDLIILEDILSVSARLIVNKSSFKFKNEEILELKTKLEKKL